MSPWFLSQQKFKCSRPNTIIRPCKPSFRFVEFSTNTYLRTLRDYKTIKSIHIMLGMSLIGMAEQEVGTINYNVTSSSSHFFLQYLMTFMFCTTPIMGDSRAGGCCHGTEMWKLDEWMRVVRPEFWSQVYYDYAKLHKEAFNIVWCLESRGRLVPAPVPPVPCITSLHTSHTTNFSFIFCLTLIWCHRQEDFYYKKQVHSIIVI